MKDFIVWLILTVAVITINNVYFANCINKPTEDWISVPLGILNFAIILLYIIFTVKLINKNLKL